MVLPDDDEDTAMRCECPFCKGGIVSIKRGEILHEPPFGCERWSHSQPREFLEELRATERKRATG
jgi:hypothetical protein